MVSIISIILAGFAAVSQRASSASTKRAARSASGAGQPMAATHSRQHSVLDFAALEKEVEEVDP